MRLTWWYETPLRRAIYEMIRHPRKIWDRPKGIIWRPKEYPDKYSKVHRRAERR